jgi:alpha-glucosidase
VPTAELFTRWLQTGVFYPFMRTHTTFGTPDQEPWSYGARHEAVNRRAIELRYELLPHLYQVMREASETGVPAMRPLFLEFPDDPQTYGMDDQFMFGRDLLVAPVLREAATAREVYLPAGDWYDYWTGNRVTGGRHLTVPVTIESIPLFVRAGSFVFRQPVVQHTGEMAGQPLTITAYPAGLSEATLYEDDGRSLAYRSGAFARRRFSQRREATRTQLEVSAVEGSWRSPTRDLVLRVRPEGPPTRVLLDGAALAFKLAEDGFVEVRIRDRAQAFALVVESQQP